MKMSRKKCEKMVKKLIKDGGSPVFGSVRSVEEVSVEGRGDEVGG